MARLGWRAILIQVKLCAGLEHEQLIGVVGYVIALKLGENISVFGYFDGAEAIIVRECGFGCGPSAR